MTGSVPLPPTAAAERGVALMAVVLVLLALVAIATPFSLSMRNQDRAAASQVSRAKAESTLAAGLALGEAALTRTAPSRDATPHWDGLDELRVRVKSEAEKFGVDANDPTGSIWSVRASDEQGRVDVNHCSPFLLANLLGGTRLAAELEEDEETEIRLDDSSSFAEQGIVWIEGELILYRGKEGSRLTGLSRAKVTSVVQSLPSTVHPVGEAVIDYRVLLATLYSYKASPPSWSTFATVRALKDIARFGEAAFTAEEIDGVEPELTVHGVLPASPRWVGAARVLYAVGPDDEIPELYLSSARNLGPGTVVRIRAEDREEYNLVVSASEATEGRFGVILQEPLAHSYGPDEAILEGLARAPVNVNACSRRVLEALVRGVRLAGGFERVDAKEAVEVADALMAARPIEGERELSQVLAGVAAAGAIGPEDRVALLVNAQNAMDSRLAVGTAPFVYRSPGIFRLEAAASENLPAGREAARRFARQIGQAIPAGPNTVFFESQLEFEEQRRLSRTGKFWTTGPVNLDGGDVGNEPSLRTQAYASGIYPTSEKTDDPAWAASAPVRQEGRRDAAAWMPDPENPSERILHFDGAPADPQDWRSDDQRGWNFGERGPLALDVTSDLVAMLDEREHVRPFEVSFWWHPDEAAADGMTVLFDTGDVEDDKFSDITNRLLMFVDGTELVFRVADASVPDPIGEEFPGYDAKLDPSRIPGQFAEIRYAFDDGLAYESDVPYHIRAYARGNKPSDLQLFVDNVPRGRRAFQTRLAEDIGPPANAGPFAAIPGYTAGSTEKIKVEDASLFPPFGVVRIDQELIEYTDRTDDELIVSRVTGDAYGGRARRGSARSQRHLESETVELHGFAAVLLSSVIPTGNVGLQNAMSEFGVAMVDPEAQDAKTPIETTFEGGGETMDVQIGWGVDVTAQSLPLVPLQSPNLNSTSSAGGTDLSTMFDQNGGFALVVSSPFPPPANGGGRTLQLGQLEAEVTAARVFRTPDGALIGLGELIYYQSFNNNTLSGIQRAPGSASNTQWLPENHSNLIQAGNDNAQNDLDATGIAAHVHISEWQKQWVESGFDEKQPIFVVPISVRPGVAAADLAEKYPVPELRGTRTLPEMVQVGTGFVGTAAGGGTEWVRYDVMGQGCLVRDEATRIRRAVDLLSFDATTPFTVQNANNAPSAEAVAAALNFESIAGTREDQATIETDAGLAASRLDGGLLAFRGVLGTESKSHPGGALVLPVIRSLRSDITGGRPGARDYLTLIDPQTQSREEQRINYAYCETDVEAWGGFACHFAFDAGVEGRYESNFADLFGSVDPSAPGAAMEALANQNIQSRDLTRFLKFPSGELPTVVGEQIFFGGDLRGEPSPAGGTIDEIEWFNPQTPSEVLPRHVRFVMSRDDELDDTLFVSRNTLRYNMWDRQNAVVEAIDPPANLPQDGCVLAIDDELVGISDIILEEDDTEAELRVAINGRGFLGTPIQFHPQYSGVRELTFLRVSRLEKTLAETGHSITVADASDFPGRGYVQVGQEIIGYARKEGNTLLMPEWVDPSNRQRVGLFRGRFGTPPQRHEDGTLVLCFPTRTEDRWHPRSDDPELSFFGLTHKSKGAYYRGLQWVADGGSALCDLVVQARVGERGAWTDDPTDASDLWSFEFAGSDAKPNDLGRQGDGLELRVFTRYKDGAFDVSVFDPTKGGDRGGVNDWKRAPRLRLLGVDWVGGPARLEYEEWQ